MAKEPTKSELLERIKKLEGSAPPVSKESIADFLADALQTHPEIAHIFVEDNHLGPLGGRSQKICAAFHNGRGGYMGVVFNVYSEPSITDKVNDLIDREVEQAKTDRRRAKRLQDLDLITRIDGTQRLRVESRESERL